MGDKSDSEVLSYDTPTLTYLHTSALLTWGQDRPSLYRYGDEGEVKRRRRSGRKGSSRVGWGYGGTGEKRKGTVRGERERRDDM
ncbi:hypothetical protein E2C01_074049 [Portunus trituberculatus]|uniref:Uncharacterized protein n=1 Tax=Portunus trituberculatus TaxID=210409 RepID=A0A5B7I4K2_PORTR|nr:hypothetical protein [Portunus trituberculatus]